MNGTELIATSEEETRSISIESHRTELAPTVQISLAKRIVNPRTNKIVCLAAQTTVPMEEDDSSSVSDLALRLSDGTNVVLSMSFFNDVLPPGGFAPARNRDVYEPQADVYESYRSAYDPDRYETYRAPDNSWRLWLVFASLCAVSLGSFFYFVPQSFQRSADNFEKSAAKIVAALPPIAAPKGVGASSLHKSLSPTSVSIQKNPTAETRKPTHANLAKSQNKRTKTARQSAHNLETTESSAPRGRSSSRTILIPPPPPTMPSTMTFSGAQMQMFGFAPYGVPDAFAPKGSPPAAKSSPPAAKSSSQSKVMPLDVSGVKQPVPYDGNPFMPSTNVGGNANMANTNIRSDSPANASVKQLQSELRPMSARSPRIAAPSALESHQPSSFNIFTDNIEPSATIHNTDSVPAPEPGGRRTQSEQPQLERIVLP